MKVGIFDLDLLTLKTKSDVSFVNLQNSSLIYLLNLFVRYKLHTKYCKQMT